MIFDRLSFWSFCLLLVVAPLSTSLIWRQGFAGGVEVSWGTVSLFVTQLLILILFSFKLIFNGQTKLLPSVEHKRLNQAFFLLFTVVGVSSLWSKNILTVVPLIWLLLGWLMISSVSFSPNNFFSKRKELLALMLVGGGCWQILIGLTQFITQQVVANKWLGIAEHLPSIIGASVVETTNERWLRIYGTMPHPNGLGIYLAISSLAAVFLFFKWQGWKRWIVFLLLGLNLLGLVLTFSRAAGLGFLSGLLILLLIYCFTDKKISPRSILTSGLLIIICLAAVSLPFYNLFYSRLTVSNRLEKISLESRLTQVSDVRHLIVDNFWLGVGPGLMPVAVCNNFSDRDAWDCQPVHNLPLLVLTEIGFVGLLIALNFIWRLIKLIRKKLFDQLPNGIELPLAALTSLFVFSLFDHFIWTTWSGQLLFWLMIAWVIGLSNNKSEARV